VRSRVRTDIQQLEFDRMPQQQDNSTADPNQVHPLVETAGAAGGEPDEYAGKREDTRLAVGVQLDVTTNLHTPSCTWPVIMHNVSDGGFAFWSKKQLRMGSEIWVREFTAENSENWLPACVTHCTVGIKGYLVGAAFTAPPDGNDP